MKNDIISVFIIGSFVAICTISLSFKTDAIEDGRHLASKYCGSCHLVPNPQTLTKNIWALKVLPVMSNYLGLNYMGYDSIFNSSNEGFLSKNKKNYSDEPIMDNEAWQKIVNYYLENAPDKNFIDSSRITRSKVLNQFSVKFVPIDNELGSNVTAIAYDTTQHNLWVAESSKLYCWKWQRGVIDEYDTHATVVDIKINEENILLTNIGTLLPSNTPKGSLLSMHNGQLSQIQKQLHRPVKSISTDLNGDGVNEFVVANYGFQSGSLAIYSQCKNLNCDRYEQTILDKSGAIKFYVKDINGDNLKDIIALFSQNSESIYVFYQTDDLKFEAKKILQFEPQYGTTDFLLLDYNQDGIDDIAVVHGDNADYSFSPKDFHGLELFLGDNHQNFTKKFFYPIYGATKVQADDFDQDGDIDFAVSSFFSEMAFLSKESFVYLENNDSDKFKFTAYTPKIYVPIKSLTLEKMDIDQDGDMDLVLGQFSFSPTPIPFTFQQALNNINHDLLIFINQHKK